MKHLCWAGWLWIVGLGISFAAAGEGQKKFTETVTGGKAAKKASFEMILIPGGKFTMGTPDGEAKRRPDEGPAREVEIKPFYLAVTEVTLDVFSLYYQETATSLPRADAIKKSAEREKVDGISCPTTVYADYLDMHWGYEGRPAIGVSWRNAANFCKWLALKTGKPYRLPTEAEWEYACRAGTKTAYSFGDDAAKLGDYAWFKDNSEVDNEDRTHPVAKKLPNPWGLYDMHGNVKEWVTDVYRANAYAAGAAEGPADPKMDDPHVARGGSYVDDAEELRSGSRQFQEDWWRFEDPQTPKSIWWLPKRAFIGLRVACPADKP